MLFRSVFRDFVRGVVGLVWLGFFLQIALAQTPTASKPNAVLGAVRADNIEVELVSRFASAAPGQSLQIGLRLKHDTDWHTYWRNAGDSGLPTQTKYTLPKGVTASAIKWPYPTRVGLADLANYALEGELVLPVTVQIPAGASTALHFEMLAQWLVCRDICIPGEALLALDIPIAKTPPTPSSFAALFDQHARQVPSATPINGSVFISQTNNTATLRLLGLPQFKAIEFFPYTESWIVPTADQLVYKDADSVRIDLKQSLTPATPDFKSPLGIVVVDGQSFEVRATQSNTVPVQSELLVTTKIAHFVNMKKSSGLLPSKSVLASSAGSVPSTSLPVPAIALPTGDSQPIGFAVAVVFALLGGLLLNLMPCVFPVLGIKLLAFAQEPTQMRRHVLFFTAGILATFVGLAALLLALRSAGEAIGWGFQMQSPLFVACLALLFVALGLNMSGVFELGTRVAQLGNSSAASGAGSSSSSSSSSLSAFFAGVLAVVVATPCSAPLMGSALGYTLAQPAVEMFAVFAAMGIGLALPYLLLALRPSLVSRLPRAGNWMKTFKELLAFPMYLTCAWLVWVFGQQTSMDAVFRLLCAMVAIGASVWLWGRWQYSGKSLPISTSIGAPALLVAAGLLVWNASQPASQVASNSSFIGEQTSQWRSYSDQAVVDGLAQGKPVFVDFTAAWCISCQANKKLVLETKETQKLFADLGVVTLRADWTKRDPVITAALAKLGRNAVPVYVVYRPGSAAQLLPEVLSFGVVQGALAGK